MQGAGRRSRDPVGADRLAISKEDRNRDMRVPIAGVENASGLVRNQRTVGEGALGRNISFRDGPSLAPDRVQPHRIHVSDLRLVATPVPPAGWLLDGYCRGRTRGGIGLALGVAP